MKNKKLIFSLFILATTLIANFISSNQDIENAINNSDIEKLNKFFDNKSEIKKEKLKSYSLLANKIAKRTGKSLKKRFDFKDIFRLVNGSLLTAALPLAIGATVNQIISQPDNFIDNKQDMDNKEIVAFSVMNLLGGLGTLAGIGQIYKGFTKNYRKEKLYKAVYIQKIFEYKLKAQA